MRKPQATVVTKECSQYSAALGVGTVAMLQEVRLSNSFVLDISKDERPVNFLASHLGP